MGSHDQACKVANEGISLATLYIDSAVVLSVSIQWSVHY